MLIYHPNAVLIMMGEKSPLLKLFPTWRQEWTAPNLESCEFSFVIIIIRICQDTWMEIYYTVYKLSIMISVRSNCDLFLLSVLSQWRVLVSAWILSWTGWRGSWEYWMIVIFSDDQHAQRNSFVCFLSISPVALFL